MGLSTWELPPSHGRRQVGQMLRNYAIFGYSIFKQIQPNMSFSFCLVDEKEGLPCHFLGTTWANGLYGLLKSVGEAAKWRFLELIKTQKQSRCMRVSHLIMDFLACYLYICVWRISPLIFTIYLRCVGDMHGHDGPFGWRKSPFFGMKLVILGVFYFQTNPYIMDSYRLNL